MYTAIKLKPLLIQGVIRQSVQFTDDTTNDSFFEEYQALKILSDWPDSLVRRRLDELNVIDLKLLTEGAIQPPPVIEPAPPPTQDQLDIQVFQEARRDYLSKKNAVDEGLTATITQQDVDDAYALMKTLYKEEYGVFL